MKPTDLPCVLSIQLEDWDHAPFARLREKHKEIIAQVYHSSFSMDAAVKRWIPELSKRQAGCTVFVLGQFAQRFPFLLKELSEQGFEIASAGYHYLETASLEKDAFVQFIQISLGVLEEITGTRPIGLRLSEINPQISLAIKKKTSEESEKPPWFWEVLAEQGIQYLVQETTDSKSSVCSQLSGEVLEICEPGFAYGSGFRRTPGFWLWNRFQRNKKMGNPVTLRLSSRELDPSHPRLPLEKKEALLHYGGLDSVDRKFKIFLESYFWSSYRDQLEELKKICR
jgi:hypothetical protein